MLASKHNTTNNSIKVSTMMNNIRATDRGYAMGGLEKPSTKPIANKRRALGDITNAVAEEDKGVQNKKPIVFTGRSAPEIHAAESKDDDRVYMQRAVDDIDGRDIDNPLLVTTYVNDMYGHFSNLEREYQVRFNYMGKQDFVNEKMRCILADWLVRNDHLLAYHWST